jgi:nickel transport protein
MRKIVFFFLLLSSFAFAHKLHVFVSEEGSDMKVFAYFYKSSPCKQCEIQLLDMKDKIFATGKTDEKGKATFPVKFSTCKVVVNGSMGHRGEVTFSSEHPMKEETQLQLDEKFFFGLGVIVVFFLLIFFLKRKKNQD